MKALGLDDNKSKQPSNSEIGMFMMFLSIILYTIGVAIFFERILIIAGNVIVRLTQLCFLAGMYFFIGVQGSIWFFRKKGKVDNHLGKLRGSLLYFIGLGLILGHYTIIGSLVQLIGLFIIFRSFLPDIYDSFTRIPYVGKYLSSLKVLRQKAIRFRISWTTCRPTAVPPPSDIVFDTQYQYRFLNDEL